MSRSYQLGSKLFWLLLSISTCTADIVIYDEPVAGPNVAAIQTKVQNTGVPQSLNGCSYSAAYSGATCIEGVNVTYNAQWSLFFLAGWIDPREWTAIQYQVYQKTTSAGRQNIHTFSDVKSSKEAGTWATVGKTYGQYGLQNYVLNVWQTITVPMSAFNIPAGTVINRFAWDQVTGTNSFYIDRVVLVGNGTIHYPNPYPPQ